MGEPLGRPRCPDCGTMNLSYKRAVRVVHCDMCDWQKRLNDEQASHLIMYSMQRTEDRPAWATKER